MSPELFKYKPYSYKSDIWALGCIMYEICNLKHAFDAENLNGLAIKILKGNYLPVNSLYSKNLRSLIDQMLNIKPANRPTIEDILNKPFIKKKLVSYVIYLHKMENDYDLYLETVTKQCKALGIQDLIDKYMNKKTEKMSASDFIDKGTDHHILKREKKEKENQMKQVMTDNDKIDEELRKLEELKGSRDFMSMPKKDRVLFLKKIKKLSDLSEKNHQLEDIRKSNKSNQMVAKNMRDRQYRDSHQVQSILKDNKDEEFEEDFEDEDFDDGNNLKNIKEDEEEDIEDRISNLKVRKETNTQNLDTLREELKATTQR